MNYLITGGAGFIGKNLTSKLFAPSNDLTVADKLTGRDVRTYDFSSNKFDKLVHLASLTNIRESIKFPIKFISQNCAMTLNCLDQIRKHKTHFIFSSSGGASYSLSPYSASKLACEAFCTAYRESYGLNTTILSLSNVYGPQSLHKTSIVAKYIKLCLNKKPLPIYGDGLQTRDFIYVDDVVNAIINCPLTDRLNVSSGITISIIQLAELVQRLSFCLTSFRPDIIYQDAIKGEIEQVSTLTDIETKTNIEEGLEKTFKWFMEYYAK